jgi:hypothetical protein
MNMNKKNSIITFLFILVATTASAQLSFPKMECTSLEGKKITLPADHNGKNTVLGMAFSQKAEKELSTWFQPAYSAFIEKPDANAIIPMDSWDVNCYFVPVFSGVLQAAAGKAEKKMKEGMDKSLQQNVLLYKGKADEIKSTLKIDKTDSPWFFVLDTTGKVLYSTSGAFTDAKMEEIEKALGQQ